ncbi:hypothetical protein LEN26_020527 [Aphanomyces euteiches]|nr:hypothetical protein LEN26_020527 [Aphanomyces euteiches]
MAAPCAICMEMPTDPVETTCGHVYCRPCLHRWLSRNDSCPMCRRQVTRTAQLLINLATPPMNASVVAWHMALFVLNICTTGAPVAFGETARETFCLGLLLDYRCLHQWYRQLMERLEDMQQYLEMPSMEHS